MEVELRALSEPGDWEVLYRSWEDPLRVFIRRRVPPWLVEDTMQDTFMRAFRSQNRVDWNGPMWPWLVTIARRACMESLRRDSRAAIPVVASPTVATSDDDDVYSYLERSERRRAIRNAFEALSPRHRRLLARWEIDGDPYERIAADEQLSTQALKSALARARLGFRAAYAAAADRAGLLAGFAFGRILGRSRLRYGRADPRLLDMSLGGLALVLAGVVVSSPFITGGTPDVPTTTIGASAAAVTRDVLRDEQWAADQAMEGGPAHRPRHRTAALDANDGTDGSASRVGLRGATGVEIADSGSTTAQIRIEGEVPVASATYEATVPVTCARGPRETACAVLRRLKTDPGG